MKPQDARALTQDQIEDEIVKLKKEEFNLRFQKATGQIEKPARVRVIRRTIARLKTVMTEKSSGVVVTTKEKPKAAPKSKKKA